MRTSRRTSRNPLSASRRARLPRSAFVFPERRAYPIDTAKRASSAIRMMRLGRVHSSSDFSKIRRAISRRYPSVWKRYGAGLTWKRVSASKRKARTSRRTLRRNAPKGPKFSELKVWESVGTVRESHPKAMVDMFPPGLRAKLKRLPPGIYKWGIGPKRGETIVQFKNASLKGAILSTRIGAGKSESFHLVIDNYDPNFPVIVRGVDDRGRTTFRVEEFAKAKVKVPVAIKKSSKKSTY